MNPVPQGPALALSAFMKTLGPGSHSILSPDAASAVPEASSNLSDGKRHMLLPAIASLECTYIMLLPSFRRPRRLSLAIAPAKAPKMALKSALLSTSLMRESNI